MSVTPTAPSRISDDLTEPERISDLPTEFCLSCLAPTLFRGNASAAYEEPPSAMKSATVATTFVLQNSHSIS